MKTALELLKALMQDSTHALIEAEDQVKYYLEETYEFRSALRSDFSARQFALLLMLAKSLEAESMKERLLILELWQENLPVLEKETPAEALVSVSIHLLKGYKNKIKKLEGKEAIRIAQEMDDEIEALKYFYKRYQGKRNGKGDRGGLSEV